MGKPYTVNRNDNTDSVRKQAVSQDLDSQSSDKYDWNTAMNKNTKKKENRSKKVLPSISGADESENKELFVRGLSCKLFKVQKDLEESIRRYCNTRDVQTVYQRVIAFRAGRARVGWKLVVRMEDEKAVRAPNFWPKGVSVREWYEDPPSRSSSSDSEELI